MGENTAKINNGSKAKWLEALSNAFIGLIVILILSLWAWTWNVKDSLEKRLYAEEQKTAIQAEKIDTFKENLTEIKDDLKEIRKILSEKEKK